MGTGGFTFTDEFASAVTGFTRSDGVPDGITVKTVSGERVTDRHHWYRLVIEPDGVTVGVGRSEDLFLAIQSLKQLLLQSEGSVISALTIEDWADYPVRGVILDISRDRVPTIETLHVLIDFWSLLKFNQLQLYMEHTFAFEGHERVWKDASPLTADEVRGLDEYCSERGIEMVPNMNSFGHMERWLSHGEYHYLAETPEGFIDPWGVFRPSSSTLAPVVGETIPFLALLYDQLLPVFSSHCLNVGGDEPWELGKGRSRDLCEIRGVDRVYTDFLLELYRLVSSRGKRMMVWADILMKHPHMVKELPKDIILVDWGYEHDHPFETEAALLAASGHEFYLCAGTSSWNSIGGRWQNAKKNIRRAANIGLEKGAGGFLVAEWGDNGHWQQFPVQFPGYLYGASAAWNVSAADSVDMVAALSILAFRTKERGPAEALMLMAKLGGLNETPIHNATLPGAILLDRLSPYYREAVEKCRGYRFIREAELLERVDRLLSDSDPLDDRAIIDELCFTRSLLSFAIRLGRSDEDGTDPLSLRAELSSLIEEYRRLWLLRSRPGGLRDSAGRFEAIALSISQD